MVILSLGQNVGYSGYLFCSARVSSVWAVAWPLLKVGVRVGKARLERLLRQRLEDQ